MKIDEHVMIVELPEWRQKGAAFCTAVLHFVTEPDFEIAGIPNPGGFRLRMSELRDEDA